MTHKIETPDKDGNGCSLDCGVAFVHTHPDGNVKHPVAVEEPTSVDNDFEFFNINPTPTQIHGYMTGVRNKAREEERERCKDLVVAHLRTNTYEWKDYRVFKTTVEEVVELLSDKK